MRAWMQVSAAAVICMVAVGCARHIEPKDEYAGLIQPEVLEKAGLQYYWHNPVPLREGETLVRLYQLEEKLYCLTNCNRLLAVDEARGTLEWNYDVAPAGQTVFRPFHVNGVTIPEKVVGVTEMTAPPRPVTVEPYDLVGLNTLTHLILLNRSTGKEVRRIPLRPVAGGPVHASRDYAIVGTSRGWYYSISLREAIKIWTESTEQTVSAPIVCFASRAYVGGEDGLLYSVRLGDQPSEPWSQKTNGPITAAFHVDLRGCFVGSGDGRLYAYNPETGQKLWQPFICNAPLVDPMQVGENSIFQWARGDTFYAIEVATGRKRWDQADGRRVLAAIKPNVYLLDRSNNLVTVDEMLGEVRSILPLSGLELFADNTASPAIYAATRTGGLFCIRLLTAGHLTVEMLEGKQ